jgi:hypothetical protein
MAFFLLHLNPPAAAASSIEPLLVAGGGASIEAAAAAAVSLAAATRAPHPNSSIHIAGSSRAVVFIFSSAAGSAVGLWRLLCVEGGVLGLVVLVEQ